jgi:hypothetical protein
MCSAIWISFVHLYLNPPTPYAGTCPEVVLLKKLDNPVSHPLLQGLLAKTTGRYTLRRRRIL